MIFKSLGDLCSVRIGRTPRRDSPQFWGGSFPWVTVGELDGSVITQTKEGITELAVETVMPEPVPPGTLLFSFKLSIGKMAIAGVPLHTNEAIAALIIRDSNELDRNYLRFALMAGSSDDSANHAVLGKVLNKAKVESIQVPLPTLQEQRRIVELLSRSEGIVRLRREAQRKAAELIPALFLDMFGDPASNPKGWPIVAFADVIGFTRYGPRFPNREYSATLKGGRVLRTTDIKSNGSISADEAPMLPMTDEEIEKYSLKPNTIVVTRTGATIGKVALYEKSDEAAVAGAYLIEVRLSERVLPRYVLHLLMSQYGQQKLSSGARAVAQPNLNVPTIAAIPVPVPPLELQRSFAAKAESMHGISAQQATALATSQATFDALLQRVFAL